MYEHSCAKAGAEGCGYTVRADTISTYLRDTARQR